MAKEGAQANITSILKVMVAPSKVIFLSLSVIYIDINSMANNAIKEIAAVRLAIDMMLNIITHTPIQLQMMMQQLTYCE